MVTSRNRCSMTELLRRIIDGAAEWSGQGRFLNSGAAVSTYIGNDRCALGLVRQSFGPKLGVRWQPAADTRKPASSPRRQCITICYSRQRKTTFSRSSTGFGPKKLTASRSKIGASQA